jgi:hypothetical protein
LTPQTFLDAAVDRSRFGPGGNPDSSPLKSEAKSDGSTVNYYSNREGTPGLGHRLKHADTDEADPALAKTCRQLRRFDPFPNDPAANRLFAVGTSASRYRGCHRSRRQRPLCLFVKEFVGGHECRRRGALQYRRLAHREGT